MGRRFLKQQDFSEEQREEIVLAGQPLCSKAKERQMDLGANLLVNFFVKEKGKRTPILSPAFENSTITDLTRTY
jgi:hypothetical protein